MQLQEGGHCSESDTTQVLKRLLQQGGRDGPSRKCEAQQVACQDQEIVFLPLDTPVWHLSEKSTGDSALMVTRAENVEWMRMVWGKMTDESAILEAITRHKKEEEIRRKQAEAELQRKRQEEERQQLQRQEQQQLGMIDQVLRALGGVSSSQKQPSGSGPGILQLLEAAHRKQQHVIPEAPTSANSHNLQALVSQLLGTQNLHPAPPPQQQVPMVDFSAVQRELELAMSKQQQLALGLQGTQQNAQGFAHRRNTSLENIGIMDIGPLPVHCGGSAQRNVFDAAHGPNNPPVSKPGTVQASLTPGTLPPGPGPFYVVTADSRIQLTGTGFYLPVASGPHHGFEEALAAMTIAANHRAPMWKDAQMVHMTSDTPIWHSLELANCRYPNMIVRASDLLEPPRFEEEPETSSFPELPAGNPGTSGGTGFAELLAGISAPPSLLLPSFSSGAQPQKTRSMEMPPPPPPTLTTNRASSPAPSVDDAADGLAAAGTSMASQQDLPMETGAKRSTGRASLFPNKKAHILGRQQSMSPDVDNEAAKDEEEDTNEKACEGFDGEAVNRAAIAVAGKPASPSHEGGGSPIVQG